VEIQLMQKVYEDAKIHLNSISLNGKFKLIDSALLQTHACYICFLESCYFDYTYEYILRCFAYVLNENVFSKEMIYEKRLSFGRKM
jgi:hypothetical protein